MATKKKTKAKKHKLVVEVDVSKFIKEVEKGALKAEGVANFVGDLFQDAAQKAMKTKLAKLFKSKKPAKKAAKKKRK